MLKKLVILLLCLMLAIPTVVLAEEGDLPVLEKPAGLSVRSDGAGGLLLRLTQPDSMMEYINSDDYWILYELDFKINDGPWKFDEKWDGVVEDGVIGYYENTYDKMNVAGILNNIGHDERNAIDIPVFSWNLELASFDLQNNTYSFRYRYLYEYEAQDPVSGEWGYKVIASPYSDTAIIGKAQGSAIPGSLEAPSGLAGELRNREDGQPYFSFTFDVPKSVEDANKVTSVWTKLDWKIGGGKWATELAGGVPFEKAGNMLSDDMEVDPIDEGGWGEIDIKENTYYFRAFFELQKPDGSIVRSPFSNIVEIGTAAFYSGASNWAKAELQKAYDMGLIPDILKGADMTKPITREEFAELSVVLYENVTGLKSVPVSPNPFTDTNNPQVLKAFNLGITTGTSATAFSPNVVLTREQCATMLFRAIKVINPEGDYSVADVKDFPDQKHISKFAVEATKYLSKLGIIKGDSKGNFMPKAVTTAQEAAGYGIATKEAAILYAVRTAEKLQEPQGDAPKAVTGPASSAGTGNISQLLSRIEGPDNLYYEYERKYGSDSTLGKVWRKNGKIREETTVFGSTTIVFNDTNTKRGYQYYPANNIAYEMDFSSEYTFYLYDLHGYYAGIDAKKFSIVGTETYNGLSCTVVTVVDGNMESKLWLSEEYGFPVKSETKDTEGTFAGLVVVMECKNIKTETIPDSIFELPAGVQIEQPIPVE